jgi:hypothetical protein
MAFIGVSFAIASVLGPLVSRPRHPVSSDLQEHQLTPELHDG